MSKVASLKQKALEFEEKKQFDKALLAYQQAIAVPVSDMERDVQLYNRAGDICLKRKDPGAAIDYYLQAITHYTTVGLFSNAIALCYKVLRQDPSHISVYHTIGLLSAKKGFLTDSRKNFLEYASKLRDLGRMDEALAALSEFVEMCPAQDDVRLMLADQLILADRKDEALEHLKTLLEIMTKENRNMEAAATLERIRSIDPSFTSTLTAGMEKISQQGFGFISLDD